MHYIDCDSSEQLLHIDELTVLSQEPDLYVVVSFVIAHIQDFTYRLTSFAETSVSSHVSEAPFPMLLPSPMRDLKLLQSSTPSATGHLTRLKHAWRTLRR